VLLRRPSIAPAGHGQLTVIKRGNRSVVTRAYATSPLRWLTPANHGHAAWVYTSSHGGGLVNGDAVAMDVEVGDGAMALVSTQASTKVYPSPDGVRSDLRASVGAQGLLAVVPDPVVCFAGARYRQLVEVDLADGAALVLLDWMTSGRRASGERWAFDEYTAALRVRRGDRWLVFDAMSLRADDGELPERLGRYDVCATVVVVGPALAGHAARIIELAQRPRVARRPDMLTAASTVDTTGCVARVLGTSLDGATRTIRDWLSFLPDTLGDDPWCRKW
jgi:urease accessory protein